MTVLFAGGRLDSVSVISGSPAEATTAGTFDTAYCDASISCPNGASIEAVQLDASNSPVNVSVGDTAYYHFEFMGNSIGNGAIPVALYDASGFPWIALRAPALGANLGVYYNSGTGASPVWTQVGSSLGTLQSVRYEVDIKITLGSPHQIEVSLNRVALVSGTFTQASLTNLRAIRLQGPGAAFSYSQILITNGRSTVGAKVKYIRATGAGGNSGWTGAATNVNEAVNADTTVDNTTTAGNRQTYAMADVTVPTNYAIVSVFHFIRGKNDGIAPANIKSVVRQGSTNYDYASNAPGIGTSFKPLPARYDTDPATGAAWTQTGFNSAEFGYLSVT